MLKLKIQNKFFLFFWFFKEISVINATIQYLSNALLLNAIPLKYGNMGSNFYWFSDNLTIILNQSLIALTDKMFFTYFKKSTWV